MEDKPKTPPSTGGLQIPASKEIALKSATEIVQTAAVRTPADLAAALRPADPAALVQTEQNQRRDVDKVPKSLTEQPDMDIRRQTLTETLNVQKRIRQEATVIRFISRFPELTIYVNIGETDREPGGQLVRRDKKIQFKGGLFETVDARVAQMIRQHRACGSQLFREESDEATAALRRAAAIKQNALRSPTYSGPTSSLDAGEAAIARGMNELDALENNLLRQGV